MLIECLHDKFRGDGSSARGRSRLREHNECNAAREKLRKAQTRDDASERTNTRGCGRGSQVGFPQLPQNRKYQESFQFGSTLVEQRAWDGCPMAHGGHRLSFSHEATLNLTEGTRFHGCGNGPQAVPNGTKTCGKIDGLRCVLTQTQ